MAYRYTTKGVCPKYIDVDLDGNRIKEVKFFGGCNGNLKAISKVVQGMTVEEVTNMFSGITCGMRGTSCSDQLTKAVQEAYQAEK